MKQQIFKNTFILVLFTFISKFLGFGRELTQATFFGATHSTDELVFSFLFLQYITGVISNVIEKIIIPRIACYREYTEELNEKVNKAFYLMIIVLVIISVTLLSSIKYISIFMKVQNPDVMLKMIYYIIPIAIILSINSLFQAVLRSFNEFMTVGVVMLVQNIIIIISIILLHNVYGIFSVLIGWLIANTVNMFHIYHQVKKLGFRWCLKNTFVLRGFNNYIRLASPVLGLVLISYINSFIEKKITFSLGEGATTMIYYGTIINDLIYSIFIISAMSVLAPALSKTDNKQQLTQNTIRIIIMVFLPITVIILCFAKPVVSFLLYFGNFSSYNVRSISLIFMGFSLGLVSLGIRDTLYIRAYSSGDTKLPFMANLIASIANIIFNYLLSRKLGVIGIAIGTTISIYLSMFYMGFYIKENYIDMEFLKKVCIGVCSIIIVNMYFILIFKSISNIFAIFGIAFLSLIIYVLVLYLLKTNEIMKLINSMKERAE